MNPNQRTLAAAAGVSQTTVSLALRNDPSLPISTRLRIQKIATKSGYRANPYVASLMSQVRRQRPESARGCIALLVDAGNQAEWFSNEIARRQHDGMRVRAAALGFRTEAFYLRAKGAGVASIDRVLRSRGIRSIVLAGPRRQPIDLSAMRWDDYACATISYSWDTPMVDRVSSHHRHNIDEVLRRLDARGYRRIGIALAPSSLESVDQNWFAGALLWNQRLPPRHRVPLFSADDTSAARQEFARWLKRWRVDALVTLDGREERWLHDLGLQTPRDLGHACINRPDNSCIAGMEEDHALIGSTAIDLLVAQMLRNEYGLPARPRLTLIHGQWHEGETLHPPTHPARHPNLVG